MSKILLAADLHLTDKDEDAYRWNVFLTAEQFARDNVASTFIIAGDLTDRKDRHSSLLVNSLADVLADLISLGMGITILRGNHDTPLSGPAYWNILRMPGVEFVDRPSRILQGIHLLPYTDNPRANWKPHFLSEAQCIIMHQTVTGVLGNNGHELINDNMPDLPVGVPIWSGDIHTPQSIVMPNGAVVNYIGAPHHINYGDKYQGQVIIIDPENNYAAEIILTDAPSKWMLDIADLKDLKAAKIRDGDMAHVRVHLPATAMDQWPFVQDKVRGWAAQAGVLLGGIEPVLEDMHRVAPAQAAGRLLTAPTDVLREFCKAEDIPKQLSAVGTDIMEEVLRARASA